MPSTATCGSGDPATESAHDSGGRSIKPCIPNLGLGNDKKGCPPSIYSIKLLIMMRLNPQQIKIIRRAVAELAGPEARVSLFGSRINDDARGGDIDLLVEIPHPVDEPAWLNARISGRISHRLRGQKIDVIMTAPNLRQFPIHDVAKSQGIVL